MTINCASSSCDWLWYDNGLPDDWAVNGACTLSGTLAGTYNLAFDTEYEISAMPFCTSFSWQCYYEGDTGVDITCPVDEVDGFQCTGSANSDSLTADVKIFAQVTSSLGHCGGSTCTVQQTDLNVAPLTRLDMPGSTGPHLYFYDGASVGCSAVGSDWDCATYEGNGLVSDNGTCLGKCP